MAVKYPEFNELKKESAFDWLAKSEGESFTKNKAIIRFDMFTQNRKVSISNDMKKAILTLLKKYVDAEQTSYACKLRSNGMPVPLLRNGYSIFNGTKYR